MNKEHIAAESGDGDRGTTFRGLDCEEKIRTVMGDDGVIETHIDVTKRKTTKRFFGGTDFGDGGEVA